jgi:enoyl-CoA hydratase
MFTGGDKQQKKYEYLLVDIKGKNSDIALVQLNRPKALNALCDGLMKEVQIYFILLIIIFFFQLKTVLESFDKDSKIACIVLTGSTRAFAGKYAFISSLNQSILNMFSRC